MLIIVVVGIVAIALTALLVRNKVYDKKIESAFARKNYDGLNIAIMKRNMYFGLIYTNVRYYELMFKYISESGRLLDDENSEFWRDFRRAAASGKVTSPDNLLYLALRNLIRGDEYPADAFNSRFTFSEQTGKLLLLLQAYSEKRYKRFVNELEVMSVSDADVAALMSILGRRADKKFKPLAGSENSKFYDMITAEEGSANA